jgi:pimeloyl-ACP methyl ester carboxylesterase
VPDAVIGALNELVPGGVTHGQVRLGDRNAALGTSGQRPARRAGGRAQRHGHHLGTGHGRSCGTRARAGLRPRRAGRQRPGPSRDVVARQIADLAAVIDETAYGPCVLAGYSWDGLLAHLLAARHSRLVAGLVLVDTAHGEMTAALPGPAAG